MDQHLSVTLEPLCACAQAIYGLVLLFEDGNVRLAAAHDWQQGDPYLSRQDLIADDVPIYNRATFHPLWPRPRC